MSSYIVMLITMRTAETMALAFKRPEQATTPGSRERTIVHTFLDAPGHFGPFGKLVKKFDFDIRIPVA